MTAMRKTLRKLAAAAALLAIALNVGWPLIADAVSGDTPSSAPAMQVAQMPEGHCAMMPGGTPNNGHGAPHCAFCTLIGDKAPVVTTAGVRNAGVLIVDLALVPYRLAALPGSTSYPPAHPRAPPALV
jgi:hypothetical protein